MRREIYIKSQEGQTQVHMETHYNQATKSQKKNLKVVREKQVADLNPAISTITVNLNGLNALIKKQR
jgi:hypothetical protein